MAHNLCIGYFQGHRILFGPLHKQEVGSVICRLSRNHCPVYVDARKPRCLGNLSTKPDNKKALLLALEP